MKRLAYSEIILTGICALLLFVISCDSETEKERVRVEREIKIIEDSIRIVEDSIHIIRDSFRRSPPSRLLSDGDTVDLDNLPASLAEGGGLLFISNGKAIVVGLPPVSSGNGSDLLYLRSLYISRLDSLNRVLRSLSLE